MTFPPASLWTAEHVAAIAQHPVAYMRPIVAADIHRVGEGIDIWDAWPVQLRNGYPATFGPDGQQLWIALAAPVFDDPVERHGHARLHFFAREGEGWHHLGPVLPDGFSPGSREWSGSTLYLPESGTLILYFTASGRRGEAALTFEQRLFEARAALRHEGGRFVWSDWRDLREIVTIDRRYFMPTDTAAGGVGKIKAFRDPGYFRDPADGSHYLFFAASKAAPCSDYNGTVAVARAAPDAPDDWTLLPPLIDADGVNNELERPHVVAHAGRYYLFWSTQRHVFDPAGPQGPNGLYGMVADSVTGPWRPLNGTGLVYANPPEAPAQTYAWMVLPDLSVTAFIDIWGLADPIHADVADQRRHFGGSFAPFVHIRLDGDTAEIAA